MKRKKRQDNEDPKYVLVSTYVTPPQSRGGADGLEMTSRGGNKKYKEATLRPNPGGCEKQMGYVTPASISKPPVLEDPKQIVEVPMAECSAVGHDPEYNLDVCSTRWVPKVL